jgi:antitoxin (DNA-binding transcriptional repressor) of toxin-antitoxin stability system
MPVTLPSLELEIAISDSYNGLTMKVSVAIAKNKLPKLLRAVEDGESVTICRRGVPVADLVRSGKSAGERPKFGTLRGRIAVNDPSWWKPMSKKEVEAFLEGS